MFLRGGCEKKPLDKREAGDEFAIINITRFLYIVELRKQQLLVIKTKIKTILI